MSISKYNDLVKSRFYDIEQWLEKGLSEAQIIKNLGVSKSSFENYKHSHMDLLNLLKRGRMHLVEEVENALVKRALGFEYEETETQIKDDGGKQIRHVKKIKKYCVPDVGACAILLKNKDRDNWTDNPAMLNLKREMLEFEKQKLKESGW